jgi:acetyl esterase/lipase
MLKVMSRLPGFVLVKMGGGTPLVIGGRTLDPMLQMIRAEGLKQPSMTTFTPEQAREGVATLANLQPSMRTMRTEKELAIPVPEGDELECRILTPYDVADPSPMILYFHQGGCVIGDIELCEPFCTILADVTGCRVLMVAYRKAPEHPFPTAAEDAIAAFEYVMENADGMNVDPERVLVAGDSAGGGLSAVICQAMKAGGKPMPFAQVLIYPWVEALADTESYREHEKGYPLDKAMMEWFGGHYLTKAEDAEDYRVSPLRNDDLSGLPRALVYTAGFDPLRDEGEAYAEKLKAAGVEVEYRCFDELSHSFTALGGVVPAAMKAVLVVAEDVKRVVANGTS